MENEPISFAFKLRPFAAETTLEIRGRKLHAWRAGKETIIDLKDVETVRLFFSPRNLTLEGYRAKIYTKGGRTLVFEDRTWRSLIEQVFLSGPYRAFVTTLCRKVARANPDALFFAGKTAIPLGLTGSLAIVTILALSIFSVRSAMVGQWPFGLAIAGFTAYFGWWSWHFVRRNRPRQFEANAIPADIIPPV